MSADTHAEAIKALLTSLTPNMAVPALDLDELQALTTKPVNYIEVYLSRRAGGEYRADGSRDNSGLWRLSTRVVASSVSNGRLIEDRIAAAFEHTTVDLGGGVVVQVDYETGGGSFEFDDGYYTALTDWTYAT